MNANDSDIDKTVDYDNPLSGIAPLIALIVFLASGGGYYVWFRRQNAPVSLEGMGVDNKIATA